ncbi:hypothetical protein GPM19_10085 [Halomonas sp. ZH2S]|uniref:Uncharacterized protein n=1 Tax=Vreelandella zhuhanensis TaxID=2684210 RepID=A0A7X3H1A5_9GAMM|nr:hypothetical protein [Halomonas zhuhanensis]MWJ28551.1 hypothetical protein [Halomonas zhuhanensis]
MTQAPASFEKIFSDETASIENTASIPLSISLVSDSGCQVEMELKPGQVINFSAGSMDANVILHNGDPANLLVIKPGPPS